MLVLDKKDKQILFELDRNSRQSINEIARKTRLSRDVVRYRIQRLEKNGFIKGYITLIDFTKLGFQIVRLYLKLQNTTLEIEEEIINYLVNQDSVIIVYQTDGAYEVALGILVKDLNDYQDFYNDLLTKFRPYIVDKNFSVLSDLIHYFRNYLIDKNRGDYSELSTGSFQPFDYEKNDILILKEISTNARSSLVLLSKKLGLPVSTIKYRIKLMEKKKLIVAYKSIIDYHKLGYEYYKVDLILEDLSLIPLLKEFVRNHPNVLYRDVAIGGSDFEFDCELRSQDDFYNLIESIRSLMPKKIRSFFYYKTIGVYKHSYFPGLLLSDI